MPASELSLGVTLAVLAAGLLHASWNAMLKSAPGGDPLLDTAIIVAGSCIAGFVVIPFLPLPHPASWKFAAASATIHFAYYLTLAQAYRAGDLSFAYPLMRGSAPLLVTVLGVVFLGEWPTLQVMVGIALICAGIVSIAFVRRGGHPPAAKWWAFANAAIIAARSRGRCREPRCLRNRAVGDDARPGCGGGGAARDLRSFRGADWRGVAEGRLRAAAARGCGERRDRRRRAEAMSVAPSKPMGHFDFP